MPPPKPPGMNGDVTVREAMTRDFVGVSEGDRVVDAASLLLEENAAGAVVLRGQEPVGLLTEKDVLSVVVRDGDTEDATVADAMRSSVPTVDPDSSIADAAELMFSHSCSQLVVTDATATPVGVLTQADIVATTTLSTTATAETNDSTVEPARVEAEVGATADGEASFSEQGICERCGSLTGDLTSFNGQLLCDDCMDV